MKKSKYLWLCAAALILGCTDDNKPADQQSDDCNPQCGNNQTCVNGVCVPNTPAQCDPPCSADQTCVNGVCMPNTPTTECDPPCSADQTCVNGVCMPNTPTTECDPPCSADQTCVNGVCVPNTPTTECDPPCSADQTCVNGICESICKPECDPVRQKCDIDTKTCLYIDNYCEPGTCSPDKHSFCPADGENAGIWGECPDGESCFHGTCLPNLPTDCVADTCNDLNQACIDGSWHQCTDAETCTDGQCIVNTAECTPGTCLENDNSYMCSEEGTPVKCGTGQVCDNGRCIVPANKDQKLLWTICNVNSDCSYGSCVKKLTLSRETADPDNPDRTLKTIPVSKLDSRIPEGKGICTTDCTKDASLCDSLALGDKKFSCQLAYESISAYPPKAEDGTDLTLPFVNELDTDEMTKGVPFAAMCRPFIQNSAYPEDFTKSCLKQSDCQNGTKCVDNVCTVPCADDTMCPLTFKCVDDAELGKFCQPASGTYTACRDKDGDGYGVGICTNSAVDCDDHDAKTFYTTAPAEVCSLEADTNCNGRIDAYELLGSPDHCSACNDICKMPASNYNKSHVCYKNNGDVELDDYTPETYVFECVKTCAPGFADCDGNASNGCELNIIEESAKDGTTVKIYAVDADGDGYGSNKDGNTIVSDKPIYNKDDDDRAFCCGSQCYGYVKSDNPSIVSKQWIEVDINKGYQEKRTDCNDADPNINPGMNDICDGIDNNCSGKADELDNLYDADGHKVDTVTPCNTGIPGLCAAGKTVCELQNDQYAIYCKADHDAESFEYCNDVSDDCDDENNEGVVAVDPLTGLPIKDEGKGWRLVDAAQDTDGASAKYICSVDPKEFPEARGKCMFGKYTCDPSRAAQGKDTVYCKPFDPDPVDFIGDDYDADCDGFDGDLNHTLFVTGSSHINGLSYGADHYSKGQILNYSKSGQLHTHPLITVKKAAEFVADEESFTVSAWYHKQKDAPLAWFKDEAACKAAYTDDGCKNIKSSWDIVISGNIDKQKPNVMLASSTPKIEKIIVPKVRKDGGKMVLKDEYMIPEATKNAWFRIYGGAVYEKIKENVYEWKMSGPTSGLDFILDEESFYLSDGIVALINMAADGKKIGSAYIKNIELNADGSDMTVDAEKARADSESDNGKSPATLIGINAVHTEVLTLDNVFVSIKAPAGKDGESAQQAQIADNHGWTDLNGLDGDIKFANNAKSDIYDLDYHYFQKGYILDKYNFSRETTLPVCNNGKSINPGHMGGYVKIDEGIDFPSRMNKIYDGTDIDKGKGYSKALRARFIRDVLGTFKAMQSKDSYTVTEVDRAYKRLWGIDYQGKTGRVMPDYVFSGAHMETDLIRNDYYHAATPAMCTKQQYYSEYDTWNFCSSTHKDIHSGGKINIMPFAPKDMIIGGNSDFSTNIRSTERAVTYDDRHFDKKARTVEATIPNTSSKAGISDDKILVLTKQTKGYRFMNAQKAAVSDGADGPNGAGGAGAPAFLMPDDMFYTAPYFGAPNSLSPTAEDIDRTTYMLDSFYNYLYLYETRYIGYDFSLQDYDYSLKNLMIGLYDLLTYYYIHQNHESDFFGSNNTIAYLMGAGGGAGGCGGLGGGGGRPGGSAVGLVFEPSGEHAAADLETASFDVYAGNGGKGADGGTGASGFNGGTGYSGNLSTKIVVKGNHNTSVATTQITPKTVSGYPGVGGTGGAGGAGAQGGYALGIIYDCSAVNAAGFADCSGKIDLTLPDLNSIRTKHGRHGFKKGSPAQAGSSSKSSNGGAGGKASASGTDAESEIINGENLTIKQVKSDQNIAVIYGIDGNKAKLGTIDM